MHKLPLDKEGPLDILFLTLTEWITPFFHNTGHIPNTITTYSLLTGLGAAYYLWRGYIGAFGILFLVSYLFDCMDGYMARRYDQETVFGDYYDHASDIIKFLITVYILSCRYSLKIIIPVFFVISMLLCGSFVYLGCSQKHSPSTMDESLDILLSFCNAEDTIHYVKYCSTGTVMVAVVAAVIFMEWTK